MTQKEHIARYLQSKLTGNELVKFNLRLARDEAFRKEVAAERLIHESILKDKQLFEAGQDKGKLSIERKKWGPLLTIVILAGISFYFYRNTTKPAPPIETVTEPATDVPKEERAVPPVIEGAEPEEREKESAPPKKQTPPANTNPPAKEEPKHARVYAANFTVNPQLEEEIANTGVRGNGLRLNLTQPAPTAQLSMAGHSVTLSFAGTATSSANDNPVRLLFFSNKKEDYEQWQPIFESTVTLQPNNGGFAFSFEKTIELEPGLYYYIFEDMNEERYLVVGKLEIGN